MEFDDDDCPAPVAPTPDRTLDQLPEVTKTALQELLTHPPFNGGCQVDKGFEPGTWNIRSEYKGVQYRLKLQFNQAFPSDVYDPDDNPDGIRGITMEMAYSHEPCYLKEPQWGLFLTRDEVGVDNESGFACPRITASLAVYTKEGSGTFVDCEEGSNDDDADDDEMDLVEDY